MEMFELQEQVNETTDQSQLKALRDQVIAKTETLQKEFNVAITSKNEKTSTEIATKMRYYFKVSAMQLAHVNSID